MNEFWHGTGTWLSAGIEGHEGRYGSQAEPAISAAAAQLGGFLLIVTHAADPAQLTPATLMQALASPMTLTGWAPLNHARRTTR